MKTQIFNLPYNNTIINYCVDEFKKGNIGIFPTDTVYGIGCDALNVNALEELYKIKKRNKNKPISVLVSTIDMLNNLITMINPIEKKLIDNFWPGSLTIIFNKSQLVPNLLTSGLSTIGIRMPNNKLCLELINEFGSPIAASSANISDMPPSNDINQLSKDFNSKISFILANDQAQTSYIPSTIVKVENNEIKILRKGSVSKSDIEKCFGGNIHVR